MKTGTLSNRFYYHELDEKDASAIKNDLVLYNSMIHKAYKYLSLKNKGVYIKSKEINKELMNWYNPLRKKKGLPLLIVKWVNRIMYTVLSPHHLKCL